MLNPDPEWDQRRLAESVFGWYSAEAGRKEVLSGWTERADIHENPDYAKLSVNEKKSLENKEAKRRQREYAQANAEVIISRLRGKGITSPNEIIAALMQQGGRGSESSVAFVESLTDEFVNGLEGFSQSEIKALRDVVRMKE